MIIQLADYIKTCEECGKTSRTRSVDGADVLSCECGQTTLYFPEGVRLVTDMPECFTVGEWQEIALEEIDCTMSTRMLFLRMAWENFKSFIRGS